MGLKMNIAKTKVLVLDNTTLNVNNVLIEMLKDMYTWDITTALRKISRANNTAENHGRLGGIRQTPGYLLKQPCHLLEETCVQLLCAASYDIWCRDLDTDQSNTEQTCGRTDDNGKKYAQQHMCKDRKTNI